MEVDRLFWMILNALEMSQDLSTVLTVDWAFTIVHIVKMLESAAWKVRSMYRTSYKRVPEKGDTMAIYIMLDLSTRHATA